MTTDTIRESGAPNSFSELDEIIEYLTVWRTNGSPPADAHGKILIALLGLVERLWARIGSPSNDRQRRGIFLAIDSLVIRAREAMRPHEQSQHAFKMLAISFVNRPREVTVSRSRKGGRVDFNIHVGAGDATHLVGRSKPVLPVLYELGAAISERRHFRKVRVRIHEVLPPGKAA